jgi:hypothetical protein
LAHSPDVCPFDRSVYRAIANYAFDEAVAWPSQQLVAEELGCRRESVNRAVQRLVRAGWLRVSKRFSRRSGWCHNVYELLADYRTGWLTIKRITRRAHARRRPGHTNTKKACSCRLCRRDSGGYNGLAPVEQMLRRWRSALSGF